MAAGAGDRSQELVSQREGEEGAPVDGPQAPVGSSGPEDFRTGLVSKTETDNHGPLGQRAKYESDQPASEDELLAADSQLQEHGHPPGAVLDGAAGSDNGQDSRSSGQPQQPRSRLQAVARKLRPLAALRGVRDQVEAGTATAPGGGPLGPDESRADDRGRFYSEEGSGQRQGANENQKPEHRNPFQRYVQEGQGQRRSRVRDVDSERPASYRRDNSSGSDSDGSHRSEDDKEERGAKMQPAPPPEGKPSAMGALATALAPLRGLPVVHPFSSFRRDFNIVISIIIFYNLVEAPYRIAINIAPTGGWLALDTTISFILLADVVLGFKTGYVKRGGYDVRDGVRVLRPQQKRIIKNYLRTWFVVDLASSLPIDIIVSSSSAHANWVTAIFRLLKLLRIHRMFTAASQLRQSWTWTEKESIGILLMVVGILFYCHVMACIEILIGRLETPPSSWLDITTRNLDGVSVPLRGNTMQPWGVIYVAAVYLIMQSFTSVGYGDVHQSDTIAERLFNVFFNLCNALILSYIVGQIVNLVQNRTTKKEAVRERFTTLHNFIDKEDLPEWLSTRMVVHLSRQWQSQLGQGYNEYDLMSSLSDELKLDLFVHWWRSNVPPGPLLPHKYGFLERLQNSNHTQFVAPGDFITHEGEVTRHLYVVRSGLVDVAMYKPADQAKHLQSLEETPAKDHKLENGRRILEDDTDDQPDRSSGLKQKLEAMLPHSRESSSRGGSWYHEKASYFREPTREEEATSLDAQGSVAIDPSQANHVELATKEATKAAAEEERGLTDNSLHRAEGLATEAEQYSGHGMGHALHALWSEHKEKAEQKDSHADKSAHTRADPTEGPAEEADQSGEGGGHGGRGAADDEEQAQPPEETAARGQREEEPREGNKPRKKLVRLKRVGVGEVIGLKSLEVALRASAGSNGKWDDQRVSAIVMRHSTRAVTECKLMVIMIDDLLDTLEEYPTLLSRARVRLGLTKGESSLAEGANVAGGV
eukprot:SM000042S15292  [mRNA]  locus=s42:124629:130237:- [translate_table: standard]